MTADRHAEAWCRVASCKTCLLPFGVHAHLRPITCAAADKCNLAPLLHLFLFVQVCRVLLVLPVWQLLPSGPACTDPMLKLNAEVP